MLTRYIVAGHVFTLYAGEGVEVASLLPSLQPFITSDVETGGSVFSLTFTSDIPVNDSLALLTGFEWEEAECSVYTTSEGYEIHISPNGTTESRRMVTNKDFTRAVAEVSSNSRIDSFVAGNFLMMLYAFATATYATLMFHASVICNNEKGYLFLGKSGTGKSTHSRLWLQHIPGSELLNDDNPIVRIMPDGEIRVYGSPWSGKTPCYKAKGVPVGAFVRLRQAPYNKIRREKKSARAFASLLPSCSCLRQEQRLYDAVCDTVTGLAIKVPVYDLECLPDAEASLLCFSALNNE